MPSSPRLALIALLLCASAALAQLRVPGPAKPEQVQNTVREFCRQDFTGARLTAAGWSHMKQLTTWKDNPAWQSFHVVSRYDQASLTAGFRSATVGVKYMTLGRFELGVGFAPATQWEEVEFRLKEIDGEWRIELTDPEALEPQVSKQTAVQWLQQKLKTATDTGDKISIETALKALAPPPK